MKSLYWLIILVAVLFLNNVLFLSYLTVNCPALNGVPQFDLTQGVSRESGIVGGGDKVKLSGAATQVREAPEPPEEAIIGGQEIMEFGRSFAEYSKSQEFIEVMDRYTVDSMKRMMESAQDYTTMSTQELFSVVMEDTDSPQRLSAMYQLLQGNTDELLTWQLRDLYESAKSDPYLNSQILTVLVERGDEQGIEHAKQLFLNMNNSVGVFNHDLITVLFDHAPDFVREHFNALTPDQMGREQLLMMSTLGEPDILESFYRRNIDVILDSSDSTLFQVAPRNIDIELTSNQQRKALSLLAGKNSEKREFGLALMTAIDDPQLLREGYNQLTRSRDRVSMLYSMMRNIEDREVKGLVQELALESDDPRIREIAGSIR